jgi:type IV pilus assembly protein PilX
MMRLSSSAPSAQRGIALISVLLLLLVLTMLGVNMLKLSILEERSAGNLKDRQLAYQATEAALRDAELSIVNDTDGPFTPLNVASFSTACTNGLCASSQNSPRWTQLSAANWTGSQTMAYGAQTGAADLPGIASQPRVLIEYQGTLQPIEPGKPCVAVFLITARGVGLVGNTNVVLQSVYRHRAGECLDSL